MLRTSRRIGKGERLRLLVADGLLNLRKPDLLEDNELCDLLDPEEPVSRSYWPRGEALACRLRQAAEVTITKLVAVERYRVHRELLQAVLQGSSVAAFARTQGVSREHISRTTWHRATQLVVRELEASANRPVRKVQIRPELGLLAESAPVRR